MIRFAARAHVHVVVMQLACTVVTCLPATVARAERRPGEDRALREQLQALHGQCEAFQLDACMTGSRKFLQRKDLRVDQRVELLEQLGASLAITDDAVAAEEVFGRLLELAPDHELDEGTPAKIITPWRSARARMEEARDAAEAGALAALRARVRITSDTPLNQAGGRDGQLVAVVDAPQGSVARVMFNHRRDGELGYLSQRAVPVDDGREWHVLVPAALLSAPRGGRLEWYAEAQDVRGRALGTLGAADKPLVVSLSPGTTTGPPSAAAAALPPPGPARAATAAGKGSAWTSPRTSTPSGAWKSPGENRGSAAGAWTTQPPRTAPATNAWNSPSSSGAPAPAPRSRWYTQPPPPTAGGAAPR